MKRREAGSAIRGLIRSVSLTSAVIMALAAAIAALLKSHVAMISIFSGWFISIVSFLILVMTVLKAFSGEHVKSAAWAIVGIVKLGILGAILWWMITRGHAEPLSFMGGFSTVVIALLIEGIRLKHGKTGAV